MEVSMLDLYDFAQDGEQGTHWNIPYLGVTLAAQIEGKNMLYMWFQNSNRDIDNMFDMSEYDNPREFHDDLDAWITEYQS